MFLNLWVDECQLNALFGFEVEEGLVKNKNTLTELVIEANLRVASLLDSPITKLSTFPKVARMLERLEYSKSVSDPIFKVMSSGSNSSF